MCKFCESADKFTEVVLSENPYSDITLSMDKIDNMFVINVFSKEDLLISREIKYCPICGRKLE